MSLKIIFCFFVSCLLIVLFWLVYLQSQKITYLNDSQEIRNLANQFTLSFDDFDLTTYKENYLPSGTLSINVAGKKAAPLARDEIEDYFLLKHEDFEKVEGQYRHLITNVSIVNQSSNSAFVKENILFLKTVQHKNLTIMTSIRCEIHMKKVNNRWFLERVTSYLDKGLD